tara:strand:+ start:367 stop:1296 length:930 start_codon:yes stop_codon:yes gene_type:complete
MEVVQQPVFLLLITCSGFFCVFLSIVPYFGFGDDVQIVKTSLLAVSLITGLLGAVLCASSSVAREIRSGTALAVLSKPVGRARFVLGKYLGLSCALSILTYTNLIACLLASRMAYDAYGSADTFSFGIYCFGGLLASYVIGGFLNYFLQVRFVFTTVIALVVLTTSMFAIILSTEAATTGASADPRTVDWRLIQASVLLFFAVLILTALALACSTRLELLPTLAVCSGVLFIGLMSDWLFLEKTEEGIWWASLLYTVIPNWQNFWLADVLSGKETIPLAYLGQAFLYLLGYTGATLMVALLLFEDRELT